MPDETDRKVAAGRSRRRPLDVRIMDALGSEWCGSAHPPADHRTTYVYDDGVYRVFATLNDGFEVGVGYPDHWHVIMRRGAARRFAWFIFKAWVADWFGLRSYVWYVALHHKVAGEWKLRPHPRLPRRVRASSHDEWARAHHG